MIVRTWRDHHRAVAIGRMQGSMVRALQGGVDESIVDQSDLLSIKRQPALLITENARVRDDCVDAMLSQHLFREHELRKKVLLWRPVIDDRDSARRAASALADPLRPKHVDDA